jgi:hypothetical protein
MRMHLDLPGAFLAALGVPVTSVETSEATAGELLGTRAQPTVALLAPPGPTA